MPCMRPCDSSAQQPTAVQTRSAGEGSQQGRTVNGGHSQRWRTVSESASTTNATKGTTNKLSPTASHTLGRKKSQRLSIAPGGAAARHCSPGTHA